MAVRTFATNNLVESHDNYVKYMKRRWTYISEEGGEESELLFCKYGLLSNAFGLDSNKDNASKLVMIARDIKLWHCITLAYDIWYDCVKDCVVDNEHDHIRYKELVDVPVDILKKFKYRVEQAIRNAKCGDTANKKYDACRFLAMFWTYLEIAKDYKTQRFFPTTDTCARAAKIFGYEKDENPFVMNGVFMTIAKRNKNVKNDESVIDIAEEVAKKVEEEEKLNGRDQVDPEFSANDYLIKFNKLKDDYNKLDAERDRAISLYKDLFIKYNKLKDDYDELNAAKTKDLDTFALLKTVLEKMKDSKMEYIMLNIDGMIVDIHPKSDFAIRTREARYGRA